MEEIEDPARSFLNSAIEVIRDPEMRAFLLDRWMDKWDELIEYCSRDYG